MKRTQTTIAALAFLACSSVALATDKPAAAGIRAGDVQARLDALEVLHITAAKPQDATEAPLSQSAQALLDAAEAAESEGATGQTAAAKTHDAAGPASTSAVAE